MLGMKLNRFTFLKISAFLLFAFLMLLTACSTDDNDSFAEGEQDAEEQGDTEIKPEDRLPLIRINTNGGTIVDEPKINGSMSITEAGSVSYDGNVGIEFRGATSQLLFPKKSYGLETRDENNEDLDVSLLGFPEEEDWVLHGPYSDKSLMRNVLIYNLAREMDRYASRVRFVELEINGTFEGTYVFMEKLKRDDGRIDINKLKDDENSGEDLTGGYILKIDKTAGNNLGEGYNDQNSFTSAYSPPDANSGQEIYFLYEEPDAEDITPEQKTYISTYISQFEDALASDDFTDENIGYTAYIDVPSFIDFFLLNELANNVDAFRLSTFMHKDKNEKLKMGPIWDFNLGFGNADYCGGGATNVWSYKFNQRCPQDFWQVPFWWDRLLQDPSFVALLKERWNTLRGSIFSEASLDAQITANTSLLEKAGALDSNFGRWPSLGTYIWPNNFVGQTYNEEIAYLQNWITNRVSWMDEAIDQL